MAMSLGSPDSMNVPASSARPRTTADTARVSVYTSAGGDLTGAVDRLRAGQRLARSSAQTDFIEASVIDARLRDVEAERRREMEEREQRRGG